MAAVTGSNGEIRYRGTRIGRCRNFSLDIARDALETTGIGATDRTYIEGIRGATGSATIIYDTTDYGAVELLNNILRNEGTAYPFTMILNTSTSDNLEFDAVVTQVSTPVAVGEVTACSVSFQVSGAIRGYF